jgi:hypothetical protein
MSLRLLTPLFLAFAAILSPASEPTTTWSGTARIAFSGTSTLHDWSGTVRAKPFDLKVRSSADGRPRHLSARVTAAAGEMDTADARRDANLRRCMQVTEHPLIEAVIDTPVERVAADGKTPTQLPFTLNLLGRPHSVVGSIRDWRQSGNKAAFDVDFEVSLKAAGIEVPSVLWLIRVGDTIRLTASVQLTRP